MKHSGRPATRGGLELDVVEHRRHVGRGAIRFAKRAMNRRDRRQWKQGARRGTEA